VTEEDNEGDGDFDIEDVNEIGTLLKKIVL